MPGPVPLGGTAFWAKHAIEHLEPIATPAGRHELVPLDENGLWPTSGRDTPPATKTQTEGSRR